MNNSKMNYRQPKCNTEHLNPSSYSWSILRLAVLQLVSSKIQEFVNVAGIEIQGMHTRKKNQRFLETLQISVWYSAVYVLKL